MKLSLSRRAFVASAIAMVANRISIVQRMRPMPNKMNNAWTIGMDS